jgi:hypothetical protein
LTVYGRFVSVMVVVEEGFVSVPFSLEDGDSWTGATVRRGVVGSMGRNKNRSQ